MKVRDLMERLAKEDPDLEVMVEAFQAFEGEAQPYGEPVSWAGPGSVPQSEGCRRKTLKLRTEKPVFQRRSVLAHLEGLTDYMTQAMRVGPLP